ncbi:MAG: LPS-assembly protein LptD [Alphaproteobacteria bacterium]
MFFSIRRYFVIAIGLSALSSLTVHAADGSNSPVDLQADKLIHDDGGQIVTAYGDVVLIQGGKTVKADEIVYNLTQDTVVATGSVEFIDANGDKHYAERAEFNNALKDGFVEGLKTFLIDGSRFKASNGKHVGGNTTVMKDAFYTPCETCEDNPDETPLWQIRSSEVEHDKENKVVRYRNARFEVKGVPVAYLPYFAHPDGSVERKSGFLTPSVGYKSDLGAFAQGSYYWNIAPDKDLTAGLMVMSDAAPLGMLQWRQRWNNASLIADGSFTYSARNESDSGVKVEKDEEFRGHLSADGLWNINNKWRSGIKLDVASDDQYLRQYDFDSDDVLENEAYVERFSGRDYAVARLLAFQDLRVEENREDQPHVLPEIQASFIGEPGKVPVIGGRWSVDASLLGLLRDDSEQDVNRVHTALGWKRRFVSDYGLVSVLNANAQGSLYQVNDRTGSQNNNDIDKSSREGRAFGYINALTSYPVARNFETSQMVVEPLVSVNLSPNISIDDDIPNEDSQDVQIDTLNLFEANRFPGVDGVEDDSHITYGLRTGLYGHDGSHGEIFLGQSYRFEDDDNPFTEGSGLDDRDSDIVGQISGSYQDDYTLDYRFQLDNKHLSSQRHEVDAAANIGDLTLSSRYLYAKGLEGTDISETREQIRNSASYYINDRWRVFGSARHDLGDNPGLRKANFGVDYIGQCISLSMIGQRTLTDDTSGDSGTEIMFRIGLKNLGEFETSGVQIGGGEE